MNLLLVFNKSGIVLKTNIMFWEVFREKVIVEISDIMIGHLFGEPSTGCYSNLETGDPIGERPRQNTLVYYFFQISLCFFLEELQDKNT